MMSLLIEMLSINRYSQERQKGWSESFLGSQTRWGSSRICTGQWSGIQKADTVHLEVIAMW